MHTTTTALELHSNITTDSRERDRAHNTYSKVSILQFCENVKKFIMQMLSTSISLAFPPSLILALLIPLLVFVGIPLPALTECSLGYSPSLWSNRGLLKMIYIVFFRVTKSFKFLFAE